VVLDRSASFHPFGLPIDAWQWAVESAPGGAMYVFADTTSPHPTFTPTTVGTYDIELTVGVGGAVSEPAVVTVVVSSPLSLSIVDPPPGAQGLPTAILVRGTVTGPTNTGVTVNGLGGATFGGAWAVDDVPLRAGTNVLTVTAASPAGDRRTITRLVGSDGEAPTLTLTPEPAAGLTPLSVAFTYALTPDTGVQAVAMDFEDDGQIDSTSLGSLSTVYGQPGPVTARLQVTDGVGAEHEAVALVDVQDFAAMDGLLVNIWNDVRTDLINGQTAAALKRFEAASQARYGAAFDQLGASLAGPTGIAASWSTTPVAVWLSSELAQYALSHPVAGQDRVFLVTFVKDSGGVWRLGGM
jgi:PKD repeat protein